MALATLLAMSLMVPYNPAFYDVIWTLPEPWPRILPSLNPVLVLLVTGVLSLLLLGLSAMRYRLPMMPLAALGLLLLGLATFSGLIISGPLAVLVVAGVALAEAVAIPFLYARAGTDLPWRAVALPYALIIAAPQIVYMIPAGEWLKQIVGGVVLVGLALFVGVGGSLLELKTDGGLRLRPAEAE